jgi:mevalonate kinase
MVDISIEDYDYVLADAISEMTSIEEDIEELDIVGLNRNIAQVIANIETTMHKQHSGMDLTVSVESNALYFDGVLKMNNALQPQ